MNQIRTLIAVALLLSVGLVSTASAQGLPQGATWDRTSIEDGYLDEFSLNRSVLGPRSKGMGSTGLSLLAGVEYHKLNPAAIMGLQSVQVFSEGIYLSGSADEGTVPDYMDEVETEFSNFSVRPGTDFGYGAVSVGMPITFLGGRGAVAASYSRHRKSPLPEEYRQEAIGALTENTPSTVGIRKRPSGGHDALTLTAARRVADRFDVGINMNYESGWIQDKYSVDVSVFGRPAAASKTTFEQSYSSVGFDVGARTDFGPFSGGVSYFFGHHIDYTDGTISRTPLFIIGDQNPLRIQSSVIDHTLSTPPRIGLGGAYELGDRLTVAADFWTEAWSNASFSRNPIKPVYTFADLSDSASFFHYLVAQDGEEVINAKMHDLESFRVGLEFYVMDKEAVRIPFRVGYQSDGSTRTQVDIEAASAGFESGAFNDYYDLLEAYRQDVVNGVKNGDNEKRLREFLEHGAFVHRKRTETTTTTWSFGAGLELRELAIDVSFDVQNGDASRYFNTAFSPQWWGFVYDMEGSRTVSTLTVGARLVF